MSNPEPRPETIEEQLAQEHQELIEALQRELGLT